MERLRWLWNYLKDLYKFPATYICSKEKFDWMCYTASAVIDLERFVEKHRGEFSIRDLFIIFEEKSSEMKNLQVAIAYNAVAKTALEVYIDSKYPNRKGGY